MPRVRNVRPMSWFLGLAIVCGPLVAGCGQEKATTVIPEVSPADESKDSMDYYRNQSKSKAGAKAKK